MSCILVMKKLDWIDPSHDLWHAAVAAAADYGPVDGYSASTDCTRAARLATASRLVIA